MKQQQDKRRPEVVSSPKWVRVFLGEEAVADSKNALLLRAQGQLPVYYFPEEDVRMEWLARVGADAAITHQGEGPWPEPPQGAEVYTVQVGDEVAENAAWRVGNGEAAHAKLAGHVAFAWQAMDAWYEEDQQIRVHPHDPYHLIDVRPSSRRVRVVVAGETVAETDRPVLLFETGLPTRYYIPKVDAAMEHLVLSDKTTHCAYKGTAPHYSLQIGDERLEHIAWHYPFPNSGYELIQNLICFYQERLDDFYVDGERLEKSKTF